MADTQKQPQDPGSQEGKISIAEEVIASIAGIAASEVEGLASVKKGAIADIVGIFGGRQKGVKVSLEENERVRISLNVTVAYGYPVREVAQHIQQRVTEDIESMTGLEVEGVDITVEDLKLPSHQQQPIEEQREDGDEAEDVND